MVEVSKVFNVKFELNRGIKSFKNFDISLFQLFQNSQALRVFIAENNGTCEAVRNGGVGNQNSTTLTTQFNSNQVRDRSTHTHQKSAAKYEAAVNAHFFMTSPLFPMIRFDYIR